MDRECSHNRISQTRHFNPLSPHGERRRDFPRRNKRMGFQSTLPTRGETWGALASFVTAYISIHSPHTGRDARRKVHRHAPRDFNPLSPHGERPRYIQWVLYTGLFQSTLPTRGETAASSRVTPLPSRFQSTLPTRGETPEGDGINIQILISIHSPHTGRDGGVVRSPRLGVISIHSPHTGRDTCLIHSSGTQSPFQSTLPTRGETMPPTRLARYCCISIHSPHTGRDVYGENADQTVEISIHSPHTGRDAQGFAGRADARLISIHSPHTGRDPKAAKNGRFRAISIHSPHTGRDAGIPQSSTRCPYFNPLSPHGERRASAAV